MSESTRARINAAFEDELNAAPVPAGLRPVAIAAAVAVPRTRSNRPAVLALVAAFVVIALLVTLVVGANLLRSTPVPSGSTTPPPARANAAVAYDAARGVLVLFGGNYGSPNTSPLAETWTWDGRVWRHLHPKTSPPPTYGAAMAYDQARHKVVLFGGMVQTRTGKGANSGFEAVDSTWTWDGSTWTEMHPADQPAFGYDWTGPTMQYDPATKSVLMHGYTRSTSETNAGIRPETWAWDGAGWRQLPAAGGPTGIAFMFDAGGRPLLLAQAPGLVGGRFVTQTWAWDGTAWTLLHPAVDLPSGLFMSGAYDPDTRRLVLAGSDTWLWDGTTWSRAHPTVQPPAAGYTAYLPSLHEVVTWNDVTTSLDYGLYGWNGTDWKVIVPGKDNPLDQGGKGYLGGMTPDQAAAAVRAQVTGAHPVLLPAAVPAGWDATVYVNPGGFTVRYQSDLRDRSIEFGITVANPPPGGVNQKTFAVKFRHSLALKYRPAGYAEYFVYDSTVPTSNRWLMWIEPGTMADPPLAGPGVPYFLSTQGLTEAEFWAVANSLR